VQSDPLLSERKIDLSCINSSTIPSNQELGVLIQELFSNPELTRSETKQIMNTASVLAGGASTFSIHKTQSQLAMSKMEVIAEDEPTERSTVTQ
jgi:hypothetical protein